MAQLLMDNNHSQNSVTLWSRMYRVPLLLGEGIRDGQSSIKYPRKEAAGFSEYGDSTI